jgi:hypothetical protein
MMPELAVDPGAPGAGAEDLERRLVDARQVDVVGDLERVLGALHELGAVGHLRLDLGRAPPRSGCGRGRGSARAARRSRGRKLRQLRVEHRVVVAQLEQLRVRELEDELHVGVVRARLDDEGVVPGEDRQVVGVVAEAVRQQLAPRLLRQRARLGQSSGATAASSSPRGSAGAPAASRSASRRKTT